jgi:hypothetical protein
MIRCGIPTSTNSSVTLHPNMKCELCKFWRLFNGKENPHHLGFCHRYPPPYVPQEGIKKDWQPLTFPSDWCGEFKSAIVNRKS